MWLVLVTLIWGSTFVMVKDALASVGPANFLALRFLLAAAILGVLFRDRIRTSSRAEVLAGILIGIWLFSGYILQTIGLQYTTSSKAGFITGMSVVMVPVFATVFLRRPPTRPAVFGVILATAGLALLSLKQGFSFSAGDLWVLGGAISFALQIVTIAHFAPEMDPLRLTFFQVLTTALVSLALTPVLETFTVSLPLTAWGAVIFTGVVATALVLSVQTTAQQFTSPTHTAVIFALEPVFAALFGYMLAGDRLGPREVAGCLLILGGMLATELINNQKSPATVKIAKN